jgi:phage anti-repressor protein
MNELVELKERFEAVAQSSEEFPIDFDDAWQWIGYSTKGNALRVLQDNFDGGTDYLSKLINRSDGKPGKSYRAYFLAVDCFKSFCMVAGTEKGKEVRKYYLQIEKAWNSPEMVIRKAVQLTKDCIKVASGHARAGLEAEYAIWIESKGMKYLENPGEKCASAIRKLCSTFKEVLDDNGVLFMHCLEAHQKLFRTCARLGISPNEVPAWKSWKEEWPDFLELCDPEQLMGYHYPGSIAELGQEWCLNSSRALEGTNE